MSHNHTGEQTHGLLCAVDLAEEIVAFLNEGYAHCLEGSNPGKVSIALDCALSRAEEDLPHVLNPCLNDAFSQTCSLRKGAPRGGYRICNFAYKLDLDIEQLLARLNRIVRVLEGIRSRVWAGAKREGIRVWLAYPKDILATLDTVRSEANSVLLHMREQERILRRPLEMLALAEARSQVKAAPTARRIIKQAIRILPYEQRRRYEEELHAELFAMAELKAARWIQTLYSIQQCCRIWHLRAALKAPGQPRFYRLQQMACWVLASDWRTWGLLGPLMAFAIVNVFLLQGWGSAFFTIPAVVAFYAGVEWLRKRWGVEVKPRRRDRTSSAE